MFGRRKKYEKKIAHDRGDLAAYTTTVIGLKVYASKNEAVLSALNTLQDKFSYSSPNSQKTATKHLNAIHEGMKKLQASLEQPEWEENEVILQINELIVNIMHYSAEGVKI